jgi:anthranilate synthase/aminodeoxychorismate synthase-like glutamine amidotransferase
MRLALLDHRDSFTLNVRDWLAFGPAPQDVEVVAADDARAVERVLRDGVPLVLSPGPKRPEDASITLAAVGQALGRVPILGICLGHQQLAYVAGARIIAATTPFHGSTRAIFVADLGSDPGSQRLGLFVGMASGFRAAVYNSLAVERDSLPHPWRVTATCDSGDVAAIERRVAGEAPAFGVQFHPESFLSENAAALRANWLREIADWRRAQCSPQASATAPLSMPS